MGEELGSKDRILLLLRSGIGFREQRSERMKVQRDNEVLSVDPNLNSEAVGHARVGEDPRERKTAEVDRRMVAPDGGGPSADKMGSATATDESDCRGSSRSRK